MPFGKLYDLLYTLLSPSGKSTSLCYFGKFSEMIGKKNFSKIFSILITFLNCPKVRREGSGTRGLMKVGFPLSPCRGRGNAISKQRYQFREDFGPM